MSTDRCSGPGRSAGWTLSCLLVLVLVLVVAGCAREMETPPDAADADRRALEQAYDLDPDRTRRHLATALAAHVSGATADALATDDLASVDRSDRRRLRVGLGFHGTIPAQGGGRQAVRGEFRAYLHGQGVVVIESLCAHGPDRGEQACADRERLLATADRALHAQLDGQGIDGVLPAGDCQGHNAPALVAGEAPVAMIDCAYAEGVMLSLYRLDGAQGRTFQASLATALAADPQAR